MKQQPKAAPVPAATTAASLRPCLPSPRRHQVRGERPAGKQGRAGCAPRKRWCVATFVEMMACAFVPARAVVGGKSAAVGAHAPQVLRAPEPDENAAAEGKPPRRHLLDSQHVEDAGRVMSSTGRFSPVYPCPRECLRGVRCAPSRGAPSELLGGLLPAPKKARAKMPLAVCVGPRWRSSAAVSCITSLWANSEAPQTSKAVHYPPCRTSYIGGATTCSEPRKIVEELQRRNASTGDGTAMLCWCAWECFSISSQLHR